MSLSTHILDTALGRPAANVSLTLSQLVGATWQEIGSARTDADGRCKTLLGDHLLTVADPGQHYHIPLLLTANGYTTYRGS